MSSINFKNQLSKNSHYTNFISQIKNSNTLIIDDILKPNHYYNNYIAKVIDINGHKTIGKVKLNVLKDSANNTFTIDDKVLVTENFIPIRKSLNPFEFNYKNYLTKQQVHRQITLRNNTFLVLKKDRTSLKGLAFKLRAKINLSLEKHGFKGDELAIINALLLGQRQEISKEIIQNYQNAGAIHILAVSGLHVGIILLLLNFILKPLEKLKNGLVIKLLLVVLLLWGFAFVAGMSASVIRAVSMFTAVAIALATKNISNTYKTLIISIFFLLLLNPYYLFEIGFQLSYLAVFFIVWIQPLIYNLWKPKLKLIDYFWQLFTVSIAAQLGVLPLSLYYFHQFPGLFFAANLIIIPFLGLILGLGIIVIILSLLDILPDIIGYLYKEIIFLLNSTVAWIAKQESFLFQDISFGIVTAILSYLMIITFFKWIETKHQPYFKYMLVAILLFQSHLIIEKYKSSSTNEFVIFNTSRNTIIAERKGKMLNINHSLDSIHKSTALKAYKIGTRTQINKVDNKIKNVYGSHSKKLLVIDSLGVFFNDKFSPELILLRDSPNINLERLLKSLHPKVIIADASNYKSHTLLWQKTCKNYNIPFHYTVRDGAFIDKR